jgi:hypothetical protein
MPLARWPLSNVESSLAFWQHFLQRDQPDVQKGTWDVLAVGFVFGVSTAMYVPLTFKELAGAKLDLIAAGSL